VEYLAQIGEARALVDLGQYEAAAQLTANIPDNFLYQFMVDWSGGTTIGGASVFGLVGGGNVGQHTQGASVADLEGVNGLPYMSGGDPRTAAASYGSNQYGVALYAPVKYGAPTLGVKPITVASGVEARLIAAEAALHAGNASTYLTTLNPLRTDGTFTTAPSSNPDSVGVIDTTWNAGTGGIAGLRPLTDPGSDSARVTLLFHERAYWLFLTGQRQGDLRRLVRNYGRDPETLYPRGPYPLGGALQQYGTDVSVQIPSEEFVNPLYRGCLSRGA
jgi:hypothetical protein